jgi:hypothetical protein
VLYSDMAGGESGQIVGQYELSDMGKGTAILVAASDLEEAHLVAAGEQAAEHATDCSQPQLLNWSACIAQPALCLAERVLAGERPSAKH